MNHFFLSNTAGSQTRPTPPSGRKILPGVLVTRKADGRQVTISVSKFHEALHERCIAPDSARVMTVTTPTGTSSVEINHSILERMPLDALSGLDIAKYVEGGNAMDKRQLIRGILEILGHTAAAAQQDSLVEKEAVLMAAYEAEQAAKKAAAVKPAAPKAAKKAAPKKDEAKEA